MDVLCLSHGFSGSMNLSQQPHPSLKFIFQGDLAVSVAFARTASRVMGITFPRDFMTKWRTAASTSGRLLFYGPVKLFVVGLHENTERRTFTSLSVNLCPASLSPCFAAYITNLCFNSAYNLTFRTHCKMPIMQGIWGLNFCVVKIKLHTCVTLSFSNSELRRYQRYSSQILFTNIGSKKGFKTQK
jgi:hypothetical protein